MTDFHYRKATRSNVWPGIEASMRILYIVNNKRSYSIIQGAVKDLGANGMFIITNERVPISVKAEITIDFDSLTKSTGHKVTATGETVHATEEGVGIKFTSIDLSQLRECIIFNINKSK